MLPIDKLESLCARFSELEEMICRPEIIQDSKKLMKLSKERADLEEVVSAFKTYQSTQAQLEEAKEALNDPELKELAAEEIPELEKQIESLEQKIQLLLLPKDPNDEKNTILEIRAGAGGEEAALFAANLFRMYGRFAEKKRWKVEILSSSEASAGGFKEIIAMVTGDRVYSSLRFEGGVHRVQRVPATESQGRIHTSTATVAVMPEADELDEIEVADDEIEISTTASGGPGGQAVNTTNSQVILKHLPTGIIIRSTEQRSQIQNRERAMQILKAKLFEEKQREHNDAIRDERRSMVGSGDRSEKIRTYNVPQSRITDHRIQLTVHNLDQVLDGDLDELVSALSSRRQAELLEAEGLD